MVFYQIKDCNEYFNEAIYNNIICNRIEWNHTESPIINDTICDYYANNFSFNNYLWIFASYYLYYPISWKQKKRLDIVPLTVPVLTMDTAGVDLQNKYLIYGVIKLDSQYLFDALNTIHKYGDFYSFLLLTQRVNIDFRTFENCLTIGKKDMKINYAHVFQNFCKGKDAIIKYHSADESVLDCYYKK